MSASDDARQAAFEMGGTCARVLAAVMPDGRTIAQHLDDGAVALFNAMGHDWHDAAAVVRDMFPTDALEAAAVEKIRDRVNLQLTAQRQADSNPDDQVAADAADDLLDDICNNAILDVPFLLDEVDRLRAENVALAAALEDIAGMREVADGTWVASAECSNMGTRCCWEYLGQPDGGPDEWCPVCVAEVAWSAWKLGVLG